MLEVRIVHPVGESLPTNTDAFKHTITGELVHNQMGVNETGCLDLVRHNASDKMRMRSFQSGHQVVQLFLWGKKYKEF